jgi:hypothetical protein
LHFAVAQAPGAGTATITTSVLLIVFAREYRQIKQLNVFFLSPNVLVCPGVVSKKHSSCILPWSRHPAPAYRTPPGAGTAIITARVLLIVFARE